MHLQVFVVGFLCLFSKEEPGKGFINKTLEEQTKCFIIGKM